MSRLVDQALVDLVDAVVAAVDIDRCDEINRLREALEPFGGAWLFDDELRLNGRSTESHWCCLGECVEGLTEIEAA